MSIKFRCIFNFLCVYLFIYLYVTYIYFYYLHLWLELRERKRIFELMNGVIFFKKIMHKFGTSHFSKNSIHLTRMRGCTFYVFNTSNTKFMRIISLGFVCYVLYRAFSHHVVAILVLQNN